MLNYSISQLQIMAVLKRDFAYHCKNIILIATVISIACHFQKIECIEITIY